MEAIIQGRKFNMQRLEPEKKKELFSLLRTRDKVSYYLGGYLHIVGASAIERLGEKVYWRKDVKVLLIRERGQTYLTYPSGIAGIMKLRR